MNRRHLLMACGLLLSRALTFAQSRDAAADPISGTWTGDMAPKGAPGRVVVNMELKFDGKVISGSVTGPTLTPGEVRTGSFDAKTGALRFEVVVKDDGAGNVFVFEGTVVKGTATGSVTGNNQTGDFKITRK